MRWVGTITVEPSGDAGVDNATTVLGAYTGTFVVRAADVDSVLVGAILHRE